MAWIEILLAPTRGSRFNLTVPAPADIDGLSLEALKALVVQLLSKSADQDWLIAELREQNARLKDLNGRPRIKPNAELAPQLYDGELSGQLSHRWSTGRNVHDLTASFPDRSSGTSERRDTDGRSNRTGHRGLLVRTAPAKPPV